MGMAAHAIASVDISGDARMELETLFRDLTAAGACSHVKLGEMITAGLERVAKRVSGSWRSLTLVSRLAER